MSYVGVDFDTFAVHLVKLQEDGPAAYRSHKFEGVDAFERLRDVRRAMPHSSYWDDVVAVAIEEPQGVQKVTVAKLKAVQGAIVACIPRAKLVEPMEPARWRRTAGLRGSASKDDVRAFAWKRWARYEPRSGLYRQDAFDAYCLALAVSRLVEEVAA